MDVRLLSVRWKFSVEMEEISCELVWKKVHGSKGWGWGGGGKSGVEFRGNVFLNAPYLIQRVLVRFGGPNGKWGNETPLAAH